MWDPHYKKDKGLLEGVQRRSTSQIPSLKELPYTEQLSKLGLPTLRFRRLRGDIIETYKLLAGLYDADVENILELAQNRTTMQGTLIKTKEENWRNWQNCFSLRIFNPWNSLTEEIVTAPTLNTFKNRLDAHRKDHPLN